MKKHISFTFSSFLDFLSSLLHNILISHLNPFYLQLIYFITLSSIGFLALKSTKPRTPNNPNDINLFFTSVSASTVSSMSTVEMEVFSDTQLVFLTVLMLLGGEVFTSMLGLHLLGAKKERMIVSSNSYDNIITQIEHGSTVRVEKPDLELKSIKLLAYLVSCYLLVAHTIGSALVFVYLSTVPGAKRVLDTKGIKMLTFSVFTTVSTFSNCGFVPTNENMVAFRKNPGLLLILIPQVMMGNTLYPIFLRLSIWVTSKMMKRRVEFRYMLESSREMGYGHLMPGLNTFCVGMTCLGLIGVQLVVFCLLEWRCESVVGGLSVYEKVVGMVFQVVNARHAGESVFDLSDVSKAILVMFVFMMYLPPYTSYLGIKHAESDPTGRGETNRKKGFWEHILFSNLTYIFIFIFLICVIERHKIESDPLNFNVLNIVVEVVSAYGNAGFSVGYSCQRQINPYGNCEKAWYGFVGKWSDEGKFLLVIVMFVGRLKKFNKRGGRAWSLA